MRMTYKPVNGHFTSFEWHINTWAWILQQWLINKQLRNQEGKKSEPWRKGSNSFIHSGWETPKAEGSLNGCKLGCFIGSRSPPLAQILCYREQVKSSANVCYAHEYSNVWDPSRSTKAFPLATAKPSSGMNDSVYRKYPALLFPTVCLGPDDGAPPDTAPTNIN